MIARNIPFHSLGEHHLLPFHGVAHVAYLPGEPILGLSKLARVVDPRRKFAILASGWGGVSVLSMIWAGW